MFDVKRPPECLSDFALDQLLAGSAERGERARGHAHLAGCVRCSVRCEALAQQRAGFLARVPSWSELQLQQSTARRARAALRRRRVAGALAAAAVLGLGFTLAFRPPDTPATSDASAREAAGLRRKGGPHIGAYVKHGERVARVISGDAVAPGDSLRFTYSSEQPVHLALLNRDATRATTYFPQGERAERVAAGQEVALDFSIKLDATLGREQVHGLFCDRPVALEPLRAALQASGQLPPLPHCRVDVLTLQKKLEQKLP